MELGLSQQLDTRLLLTQSMLQSLRVLQMNLVDLRDYVLEATLSNPVVELQDQNPAAALPLRREPDAPPDDSNLAFLQNDIGFSASADKDQKRRFLESIPAPGQSFPEMLLEQLRQLPGVCPALRRSAAYIIRCLSSRGYLDTELSALAADLGVPAEQAAEALRLVQSLQPAGVGARSLAECLLLQIPRSSPQYAQAEQLLREGLQELARRDYPKIARLLHCSSNEARQLCLLIYNLNPIPSQGFGAELQTVYQIPEAHIHVASGQILVELNRSFLPGIVLNQEICQYVNEHGSREDLQYLKKNQAEAQQLQQCISSRWSTLELVLREIIRIQQNFFLHRAPMQPLSMQELADRLGMHVSTISRTVSGKYIEFRGASLPLRSFFAAGVAGTDDQLSTDHVKKQIAKLIQEEQPGHPLSDEQLRLLLLDMDVPVSRRTIAKYRQQLGIAASSERRRKHDF